MQPKSAYFWWNCTRRLLFGVGIWGGLLALLSFAKFPAFWPQLVGLPVLFGGMIGALVMMAGFVWRRKIEEAAGFTTINGYARNLQQRNPYTGAVIREAGEPFLHRSIFASLLVESRNVTRPKP